jgi:hypothetical protein
MAATVDYLGQAGIKVAPGDTADVNAVNAWLGKLSASDRQSALNTLKGGNPAGLLGDMTLPWSTLNPMPIATLKTTFTQLQGQYKPAPATQSPAEQQRQAANQAQNTATTAATTATAQLPDQTDLGGQGAEGIPVTGNTGTTITGTSIQTGFNSLLQNYYQTAFAAAQNDPTQLAQLAGTTPQMLQQLYQQYTAGFAKAQQGPNVLLAHQRGAQGQQPISLTQFAQQKAQNTVGPWAAVLSAINGIYQSQFEQPMPSDLALQVITALNQMPQVQQSNVLYEASLYMSNQANASANKQLFDQTGTAASALLSALPSSILTYTGGSGTDTGSLGTGGIVGTYTQAHPSPFLQQETVETEIAQDFQQALNRAPTAADLKALGSSPTPAAIKTYLDNQPMPGYPGMTYGAYTTLSSQVTPQWQEYFNGDPNAKQLAFFAGKSPEQITDYFNNSMSRIPGVTIGRYNDYLSFISNLDTEGTSGNHAFSQGVDDSLMEQLHNAVTSAATGKDIPAPMK